MIRSEKNILNCTLNNSSIALQRLMIIQDAVHHCSFFFHFVSYGEQTLKYVCLSLSKILSTFCETEFPKKNVFFPQIIIIKKEKAGCI